MRRRDPFARTDIGLALPILMFVSVGLLVLSRMDHTAVRAMRWQLAEVLAPIVGGASGALEPLRWVGRHVGDFFALANENDRLKSENQRLKGWEWRAKESERKLAELSTVASVVRDPQLPFVTARVIANSSGAFVRSALINAGVEQNVKPGYPVLNGDGLVGRIVETGRSASRVLLLTDLNSRVPVLVGRTSVRAILAGDNGPHPRLTYLPADALVVEGDEVVTSGIGGIFPRGLRIGTVRRDGHVYRTRPHADIDALEYLSVLFYESPARDLMDSAEAIRGAGISGTRTLRGEGQAASGGR